MPRPNLDALVYCIAWALLAGLGFRLAGLTAGLLLTGGLFPIIMLSSMTILSRTGNFAIERTARWSILVFAAVVLASYLDIAG